MSQFPPNATLHGVLLSVQGLGVLLLGSPKSGKSELALQLLARGHRLVADDCVCVRQSPEGRLLGKAPLSPYRQSLHLRPLGMMDITELFGPQAFCEEQTIDWVVRLHNKPEEEISPVNYPDPADGIRRSTANHPDPAAAVTLKNPFAAASSSGGISEHRSAADTLNVSEQRSTANHPDPAAAVEWKEANLLFRPRETIVLFGQTLPVLAFYPAPMRDIPLLIEIAIKHLGKTIPSWVGCSALMEDLL